MPDSVIQTVCGYVRVSTENQLENYSIDEQARRIESFCRAKGWRLQQIFTDGGYSGGTTDRPALHALLRQVRRGGVDAVVVYKLDRLSRSQKDTLLLIEDEFLAHHTDFVSINENFDTSSPFGRAMIGMLSVFAQLEKDQITERFTMGRIGRSKAGYFHGGGSIPFGYRYENGLLLADGIRAMLVRDIFARFLAGQSLGAIARDMAASGGDAWTARKVRAILSNSVYIGKVKFAGAVYDGVHEALISSADFAAANRLLAASPPVEQAKAPMKTPFRAETLLSGLVRCGRCGARYAGAHGFYKCYSRSKTAKKQVRDPACKNDNWPIETLDRVVSAALTSLLSAPGVLENVLSHVQPHGEDPAALRRLLQENRAETARLLDLAQHGAAGLAPLAERLTARESERVALEARLAKADAPPAVPPQTFAEAYARAPLAARRLLLSTLISRITLDGARVEIQWRI